MKYMRTTLLCLFSMVLGTSIFSQAINHGKIKILVKYRLTGLPITNTKIRTALNSDTLLTTTDGEGYCMLTDVKPGKYSLYVRPEGYRGMLLTGLMIGEGKTAYPTFELGPDRELTKKEKKQLKHR